MAGLQNDVVHSMRTSRSYNNDPFILHSLRVIYVYESLSGVPLYVQVIDETLRIGGIAIWLMREAKEDVNYQGIFLFHLFEYVVSNVRRYFVFIAQLFYNIDVIFTEMRIQSFMNNVV